MINLLPLEEKQKLFIRDKEKLAIIWGDAILICLVCLALILLSIRFYILADTDYQKYILNQNEQKNQTADFANFKNIIQKYNTVLVQVNTFYKKEIYFNQVLENIMGVPRPSGIYFTKFSIDRDKNGTIKVIVSGVSDTRNNLLIFKKNIEDDKNLKNPTFSPESWINPQNANFSLTFGINEKQ